MAGFVSRWGVRRLARKQRPLTGLILLGSLLGVHLVGCGGPSVPVESLPPDSRTEIFDATPTRVYLASLEVFAKKWIDVVQGDQDQGLIIFGPVYDPSAEVLKRRPPEAADNLWGEDRRSGSTFLSPLPKAEPSVESRNSDLDPYVKTGVIEPTAQALLLTLEPTSKAYSRRPARKEHGWVTSLG